MKIADPQQATLQEEIPLLLQHLPVRGARIVRQGRAGMSIPSMAERR